MTIFSSIIRGKLLLPKRSPSLHQRLQPLPLSSISPSQVARDDLSILRRHRCLSKAIPRCLSVRHFCAEVERYFCSKRILGTPPGAKKSELWRKVRLPGPLKRGMRQWNTVAMNARALGPLDDLDRRKAMVIKHLLRVSGVGLTSNSTKTPLSTP